jgi:hypothetical protein
MNRGKPDKQIFLLLKPESKEHSFIKYTNSEKNVFKSPFKFALKAHSRKQPEVKTSGKLRINLFAPFGVESDFQPNRTIHIRLLSFCRFRGLKLKI